MPRRRRRENETGKSRFPTVLAGTAGAIAVAAAAAYAYTKTRAQNSPKWEKLQQSNPNDQSRRIDELEGQLKACQTTQFKAGTEYRKNLNMESEAKVRAETELQNVRARLEKALEEVRQERSTCQTELNQLRQNAENADVEVKKREEALTKANQVHSEATEQHRKEIEKERTELRRQLGAVEELRKKLREAEEGIELREGQLKRIRQQMNDYPDLRATLKQAEERAKAWETDFHQVQGEKDGMLREIGRLKTIQAELDVLKSERDRLKEDARAVRTDRDNIVRALDAKNREAGRLAEEKKAMEDRFANANIALDKLRDEAKGHVAELEKKKQEAEKQGKEMEALNAKLASCDENLAQLRQTTGAIKRGRTMEARQSTAPYTRSKPTPPPAKSPSPPPPAKSSPPPARTSPSPLPARTSPSPVPDSPTSPVFSARSSPSPIPMAKPPSPVPQQRRSTRLSQIPAASPLPAPTKRKRRDEVLPQEQPVEKKLKLPTLPDQNLPDWRAPAEPPRKRKKTLGNELARKMWGGVRTSQEAIEQRQFIQRAANFSRANPDLDCFAKTYTIIEDELYEVRWKCKATSSQDVGPTDFVLGRFSDRTSADNFQDQYNTYIRFEGFRAPLPLWQWLGLK